MRECFKCGYKDLPIWRHKRYRLFTCYCHIDELEFWDNKLAMEIRVKKNCIVGNYIYHLTKSNYVDRIHVQDSVDGKCYREPEQEKALCKFLVPGQTKLLEIKKK